MAGFLEIRGAFVQTGDPTTVNEVAATVFAPGQIGKVFVVANSTLFSPGNSPRIYQFVQRSATDAVTLAVPGSVAFWKSYDTFTVTSDASDAYDGAGTQHVAGCFPGIALAVGNYGFIQVGGQGPCNVGGAPTSAPSTAGKPLVSAGADLVFDSLADYNAAGTSSQVVGKTLTAVNAGSIGATVCEALYFPTRVGW